VFDPERFDTDRSPVLRVEASAWIALALGRQAHR
jgi:hypothetical protein